MTLGAEGQFAADPDLSAAAAAQTAGSLALAKGRSIKAATKAAMFPVKKKTEKRFCRGRDPGETLPPAVLPSADKATAIAQQR